MYLRRFPRSSSLQSLRSLQSLQSLSYRHRATHRPFRSSTRHFSQPDERDKYGDPKLPLGRAIIRKVKNFFQTILAAMVIGGIISSLPTWEDTLDFICRVVPPKTIHPPSPILSAVYKQDAKKPSISQHQAITRPGEFRVLVIEPGSGTETMKCHMINVKTSWRTRYEALSYVWGDDPDLETIVLEGEPVGVTKNLYSALMHLRHPKRRRIVWTDALCIDQLNLEEQGEQVKMMGEIYRAARKVIIWLGEESEDVREAFSIIRNPLSRREVPRVDCTPVVNLLRRPWFQRTWVIQEAVLARVPILACGLQTVPWEKLADFCNSDELVEVLPDNDPDVAQALRAVEMITHGRLEYHTEWVVMVKAARKKKAIKEKFMGDFGLVSTLYETRGFKCKFKQDKVFGILSMVTNVGPEDEVRKLNKKASVEDVYETVATWDIKKNQSLELLSYCSRKEGTHPDLPSWVPDFSDIDDAHSIPSLQKPKKLTPKQQYNERKLRKEQKSNPGFENNNGPEFLKDGGKTILVVSGRVVDVIGRVGQVADNPKMVIYSASEEGKKDLARLNKGAIVGRRRWFYECVRIASEADPVTRQAYKPSFWKFENFGMSESQFYEFASTMAIEWKSGDTMRGYAKLLFQDVGVDPKWHETWKGESENRYLSPQSIDRLLRKNVYKRRFCATEKGNLGWVPRAAMKGDLVCQISGAQVPIILRRMPEGDHYMVVGDAFIRGSMVTPPGKVYVGGERLKLM